MATKPAPDSIIFNTEIVKRRSGGGSDADLKDEKGVLK
jgi:hypothetical protein